MNIFTLWRLDVPGGCVMAVADFVITIVALVYHTLHVVRLRISCARDRVEGTAQETSRAQKNVSRVVILELCPLNLSDLQL